MALGGAILSAIGAVLVLLDVLDRWRNTTNVIDGGDASTDFQAELRQAKRRALWSALGPILVLAGSILTVLAI